MLCGWFAPFLTATINIPNSSQSIAPSLDPIHPGHEWGPQLSVCIYSEDLASSAYLYTSWVQIGSLSVSINQNINQSVCLSVCLCHALPPSIHTICLLSSSMHLATDRVCHCSLPQIPQQAGFHCTVICMFRANPSYHFCLVVAVGLSTDCHQ